MSTTKIPSLIVYRGSNILTVARLSVVVHLLLLTMVVGGCDSDGDFQMTQSGLLSVTPESLIFPVVAPGQRVQQELSLRNVGSATITIVNTRFSRDDAPYEVSLPNGDPLPSEVSVEPG